MKRLTEWIESDGEKRAIPVMDDSKIGIQDCLKKLAEYEDLEEKGQLIKLLRKVGDTAYVIEEVFPSYRHSNILYKRRVKEICISSIEFLSSQMLIHDYDGFEYLIEDVFFTREEAEAALEKMKGE